MTKEQFIEKYRKVFGCKSTGLVCWCKICTCIEKAWEDVKESMLALIKGT